MREQITRLMWEDLDGFLAEVREIAREETKRKVISPCLKDWWTKMEKLLEEWPGLPVIVD